MQLSSVVLPAPFGPMRPCTAPSATAKLTPDNACTPPKRTPRSSMLRIGGMSTCRIGNLRQASRKNEPSAAPRNASGKQDDHRAEEQRINDLSEILDRLG